MFEHTTTYYDIAYLIQPLPHHIGQGLPVDPDPNSFFNDALYLNEINRMSNEGWEMVSVAPLLRGVYDEHHGISYSLTCGYFLFWKRQK